MKLFADCYQIVYIYAKQQRTKYGTLWYLRGCISEVGQGFLKITYCFKPVKLLFIKSNATPLTP